MNEVKPDTLAAGSSCWRGSQAHSIYRADPTLRGTVTSLPMGEKRSEQDQRSIEVTMLSWLRKLWQRPKTMCDVDFGEMTYMNDYWEGQGKFPPTGDAVEYFLDAGPDGATPANRTFLRRVCDEYAALEGRVRVLMQGLPADQRPVVPLRPSSLDIRQETFETAQWELTLKDARDTMFVLRCMGAQPHEVRERY